MLALGARCASYMNARVHRMAYSVAALLLLLVISGPLQAQHQLVAAYTATEPCALAPLARLSPDSVRRILGDELECQLRRSVREGGIEHAVGLVVIALNKEHLGGAVHHFESNIPDSLLSAVVGGMLPRLAYWPADEPIRLAIRLDSPAGEANTWDSKKGKGPELLNANELRKILSNFLHDNFRRRQIDVVTEVEMLVGRDGRIMYALVNGGSGVDWMEDLGAYLATRMRFSPATYDGEPTDMWVHLPIRIENH